MLLLFSCTNPQASDSAEDLSDQEMKNRVEAEEIEFDNDSLTTTTSVTNQVDPSISERPTYPVPPQPPSSIPSSEWPTAVVPKADEDESPGISNRPVPPHGGRISDTLECGAYRWPDVPAEYPGGIVEMKKFIAANLIFPNNMHDYVGRVYVSFEVEKDGCLTQAKIMRGVSEEMDQAALNVVEAMPQWIPAKNNGKVVVTFVRLPISFTIN